MSENINGFKNISIKAAKEFIDNTDSNYTEKTKEKITTFDVSWIEEFESKLPFIDNIVRNPRRFIVPEEEVTIIEKTKKVTEESIRHLAKHASLVREIDDDGFVKPSKLLNVYKEETYDLYENRFMYSLIQNLHKFILRVLNTDSYEAVANIKKEANYTGETSINGEKVKIKLDIELNKKNNDQKTIKDFQDILDRINKLKEIIYGFISSDFIKGLSQAVPVKSPIRKTNVFLKEQNFKKALELWEFLERYQDMELTSEIEKDNEINDKQKQDNFDFLYYIGYNMINPSEKPIEFEENEHYGDSIYKFVENYVMEFDGTEKEFQKMMNNQYRMAINKKKKDNKEVLNEFRKIIIKFNKRRKKALQN